MAQTPVTKTLTDLPVYADTGYAGHLLYTDSNIEYRLPLTDIARKAELTTTDGYKYLGTCPDLATLRTLTLSLGQQVYLAEHTAGQGAGGGMWYCFAADNTGNYVDDNGCQVIATSGAVYRRKDIKNLYSDMFGLMAGGNIDPVLNNMYIASRTFKLEDAWICHQGYGNSSYRSSGGLTFSLADGMGFFIRGVTSGAYGPTILHAGNNVCLRLYKNIATAKEFWVSGGFFNLRIVGRDNTYTTNNSNAAAIALQASDMWGCQFKHLYISGYIANASGAAISLYNDTAWTEGSVFEDIIIRSSVVGLWMHRNTATGATGTNSFFNTRGNIDINAGVSGTAINYVKIGDNTSAGSCFLYGHDLTITGWMSNGSWHNGIYLTNYSTCVNGVIRLNWDGYGISAGASSEVIHLIRLGGVNSKFDCDVLNTSGQGNSYPLSMLQLIANSCMYLNDSNLFEGTLTTGYPILRPKGLVMKFRGTFTQAECVSGMSYQLTALLPGTRLRVKLHSWNENSKYQTLAQEWDVHVRGTDYPAIVKPIISTGTSLATTTKTALTSTGGATDTFVATATLTTSQLQINAAYGSSLTLTNAQTNNGISYAANSGRKINIVLPANAAATQSMPYEVEIEVM